MKTQFKGLVMCAALVVSMTAQSQEEPDVSRNEKTLFEQVANIQKKQDYFHLYLNMNGSADANFRDGFTDGVFRMHELRIEAKGKVADWLSYRYRQRINRGNDGSTNLDNLPSSIDWAGLGIQVGKKFSIFAGKQGAAFGGFETYINPIEDYEPAELTKGLTCFLSGANFIYDFTPSQQLQLQFTDDRIPADVTKQYGAGYKPCKLPIMCTLNWNARWAGVFYTRYSASIAGQTRDCNMKYFALGNRLLTGAFDGYLDVKYSLEDVDNKGVATSMLPVSTLGRVKNTSYLSVKTLLKFRLQRDWNIVLQGTYDRAALRKDFEGAEKGNYRNTWGYLCGVEYYPIKNSNLHFFLIYSGKQFLHTDRAKVLGNQDYRTDRISLGYIYQLPMF